MPLPAGPRPAWAWAHDCGRQGHHTTLLLPRSWGGGAQCRSPRGDAAAAAPRLVIPGSGLGPMSVGAIANTLFVWGRAGATPLSAGPSLAKAGPPRVWMPQPWSQLVGAYQRNVLQLFAEQSQARAKALALALGA